MEAIFIIILIQIRQKKMTKPRSKRTITKLVCNDRGYNKITTITRKFKHNILAKVIVMKTYLNVKEHNNAVANTFSWSRKVCGYNKTRLYVITESLI